MYRFGCAIGIASAYGRKRIFILPENTNATFLVRVSAYALRNKPVQRIALCGGTGIFLLPDAIKQGADVFITADVKYHEFFDAETKWFLQISDIMKVKFLQKN
jgi:putative NIF3 family GTP cyclohydrolase 1 type 2